MMENRHQLRVAIEMLERLCQHHNVPAYLGGKIKYEGHEGTIVGSDSGMRLLAIVKGWCRELIIHPTDENLEYESCTEIQRITSEIADLRARCGVIADEVWKYRAHIPFDVWGALEKDVNNLRNIADPKKGETDD